jgi:phytoene dehydrogenase-like protein
MARIIVIGAGMAGLAVAARLANRENSVVVCEASAHLGGALSSWQHDDLTFDTGAYTLTLPAVYRDLFIKTGSRKKSAADTLEDRVDLRPVDPVRRYLFPDGTRLDIPNASRGRLHAAFDSALGTGAGDAWLRVLDCCSSWTTTRGRPAPARIRGVRRRFSRRGPTSSTHSARGGSSAACTCWLRLWRSGCRIAVRRFGAGHGSSGSRRRGSGAPAR